MVAWKQADRSVGDGPVGIERVDGMIRITAYNDGVASMLECSEFNAARLLGLIALMLHVPTTASFESLGKRIKMFDPPNDRLPKQRL